MIVQIKQLEWEPHFYAKTDELVSLTADLPGREWAYKIEPVTANVNFRLFIEGREIRNEATVYWPLSEAKAAAQTDYETRILSALISSPGKDGGQEVEAAEWQRLVGAFGWQRVNIDDLDHYREKGVQLRALYTSPPSPQSTVDADAVIERLTKALRSADEWMSCVEAHLQSGEPFKRDRDAMRGALAALAKSPSSDRAASEHLSPWSGWDRSSLPFSEAKHKDRVCYAAFGQTWSMEDAHALISFIDRTWGGAEAKGSGQ